MRTSKGAGVIARLSWALLPASVVMLSGCATTEGVEQEQVYTAADGFAVVDTFTYVATVEAIDAADRKVTVMTPDGHKSTFKAGKKVDLAGFHVGEQVGFQATEAMALVIRKDGPPPGNAAAIELAAATNGQTTGVFDGEAVEVSAKVTAIDSAKRLVTFEFADGSMHTMKAHKKVDLSKVAVGDAVTLEYAESLIVANSSGG
jgi:FAD/FMN-containing dehydrogenase